MGYWDIRDQCSHTRDIFRDAMEQMLKSGTHLVVDRYAFSGVAFSSAKVNRDLCASMDEGTYMRFILGA